MHLECKISYIIYDVYHTPCRRGSANIHEPVKGGQSRKISHITDASPHEYPGAGFLAG